MSHFTVTVVAASKEAVDDLLAPYNENTEVEPYVNWNREIAAKEHEKRLADLREKIASNDTEKYNIEYCVSRLAELEASSAEEFYLERLSHYEEENVKDGEGYSTYNPKSKWDWYEVGGRWDGCYFKGNRGTVKDFLSRLDKNGWNPTFALVTSDGEWHAQAEMWWWAITFDDKPENDWKKEFIGLLGKEDPEATVYIMDCHI